MGVFQDITSVDRIFRAIVARENKSHGIGAPFSPKQKCRICRTGAEWRSWIGFVYLRPAGVHRRIG